MSKIEKKNYILRHIILIVLIALILFPIVWVLATSIRRDNAAVSTKLFSSRVTLRHYRELLFPRDNIPEVISDISRLSQYLRDYRDYTVEEAEKRSSELIKFLKEYFDKTIVNLNKVENLYDETWILYLNNKSEMLNDINEVRERDFKLLEEEFNHLNHSMNNYNITYNPNDLIDTLNDFINLREEIFEELINSNFEENQYYIDTLNLIYSIPLNTTVWNIRVFRNWKQDNEQIEKLGDKILELGNKWNDVMHEADKLQESINNEYYQSFKNILETKEELNATFDELNSEYSFLQNKRTNLRVESDRLFTSLRALTDTFKVDYDRISSSYELLKKYDFQNIEGQLPLFGQDKRFYDLLEPFNSHLNDILNNINNIEYFIDNNFVTIFENLNLAYNFLNDNFSKIYQVRDNDEISSAYQTFLNTTIRLNINIDELTTVSGEYKNIIKQLHEVDNSISEIREERYEVEELKTQHNEENKTVYELIEKLNVYKNLIILKKISSEEINSSKEAESFAKLMDDRYYNFYRPLRRDYFLFTWENRFFESWNRFNEGKTKMFSLIDDMTHNINIFENDLSRYLKLNFGSSSADVKPVDNITMLYRNNFGGIQADLSRAGRIVSDMADNTPYRELRSNMRNIDRNLYHTQNDWERKIRKPFTRWLFNSIMVAGLVALFTVLMTSIGAYPFSRLRFVGRQQGIFLLMIVQMFPIVLLMVAVYSIISFIGSYIPFLGLNTLGGLIFAYMANISYNLWLFKGYYDTIPDTLEESAMIDGCTRFQTYYKIVLPLSAPIVSVITILTFMNTFNEFVIARILLSSETNFTYAVGLQTFSSGPFQTEWGMFTAASLIGMAPMVALFLFMQKWIVGGLTSGSVKG